ncbi:MAG: hypothetical protein ACYDAD_12700, partial [Acidimicrobiales bacterium]
MTGRLRCAAWVLALGTGLATSAAGASPVAGEGTARPTAFGGARPGEIATSARRAENPADRAAPTGTPVVGRVTMRPVVDAWYVTGPRCLGAAGCTDGPAASPAFGYQPGSMHVGVSAGQEADRSYLVFNFASIPPTAILKGAALTVPLDPSPLHGAISEATARVVLCLATMPIRPVEGSTERPPGIECTTPVSAVYSSRPAPELTADLTPILDRLVTAFGLALVPGTIGAGDTWHLVYAGHQQRAAATEPARMVLTYDQL